MLNILTMKQNQATKIILNHPSVGMSPSQFPRVHVEMVTNEVGRFVGYDPRSLVAKPTRVKIGEAPKTRKTNPIPHNVSLDTVNLQNQVQRSIDTKRVGAMVQYLRNAFENKTFADWGAIEVVTCSDPDISELETGHKISMPSDAAYFIADGQHRYCAILDFAREFPQYANQFTQAITISVMPLDKLAVWAGQAFHDRNYFAVAVRAGKALSVDYRDPLNTLTKELATHPVVIASGGIAYERDTLLKGDSRLTTHSVFHRFVRGFLFGRPGLDMKGNTPEFNDEAVANLRDYLDKLGDVLPWAVTLGEARDTFLTRASVIFAALSVIGHDLYSGRFNEEEIATRVDFLRELNWTRTNMAWVGIIGTEKEVKEKQVDGTIKTWKEVSPSSARPAIDATIKALRANLDLNRAEIPPE